MMFFALPLMAVLWIYILAAVLPAVFLMRYIYRQDSIEKEPPLLLASLILMGVAAALVSILLESVGESVLPLLVDRNSPRYAIFLSFLVVVGLAYK